MTQNIKIVITFMNILINYQIQTKKIKMRVKRLIGDFNIIIEIKHRKIHKGKQQIYLHNMEDLFRMPCKRKTLINKNLKLEIWQN